MAVNSDDPGTAGEDGGPAEEKAPAKPRFILYQDGAEYQASLYQLLQWTHHVLLPVYGREVSSTAPWCSRWWEHPEAVAQLHGLWLAWAELTGPNADNTGPSVWHRDFLGPIMGALRDPMGPFAGCKPGSHRAKEVPPVDPVG
ncbi:DUF4913 domain-containing protein [Streptomyces reniochalinae]|uniref:DUF4913 domain-containing protein n=1 Tax=Streptomyces reniochalinae TaxID=2250578 RepID=A0A367ECG5_9ACTN|nr:DUF4913 domain-containing protein [Streptomyces reniochalinae]RCG15758.1 DUF4913 domain-containing protein [Streptomyces reniochalinae]